MRQIILQELVPSVLELAQAAGAAIMQVYTQAPEWPVLVAQKSDDSPLTRADVAAHRVIEQGLMRLTPALPVVSEEDETSFQHRTPEGTFWLVDPLDGTKEFLARNGEFTVNIALIAHAQPVWGVVYAPALELLYWGGQGWGAWRQVGASCDPIRVAQPVACGNKWRVVASKSHLNAETSAFIERLGPVDLVQAGSSLKFCRVAEGAADVYPRLAPTCEWDTAAAQAVVEGAGGCVLNGHGMRLQYGKPNVLNPHFVVSSAPLHPGAACD